MNLWRNSLTALNRIVVGIGLVALGILPFVVFYDVTARYVFNAPTIWATETAIHLLQILVFLPMGLLLRKNQHIRSTLIVDLLPRRAQKALEVLSTLLVAVLAVCITWLGWKLTAHAWNQQQVSATLLAIPLWIPNALIPGGGFLLLANALGNLVCPEH